MRPRWLLHAEHSRLHDEIVHIKATVRIGAMSDEVTPRVSVLIPVLNEESHLPETLPRMRGQDFEGDLEFIFIDGGSIDRTRELIEKEATINSRVKLLHNPAGRIPNALNIGLDAARGEFVARMDAHTLYPFNYLQLGVNRLERGDTAWVAGPAIAVGRSPWSRAIAMALSSKLGTGGARFRSKSEEEFESITGFAGVWRRQTLEKYGGWDEEWPINEDSELAARIRADGGKIVCVPAMAADYAPRESLKALARQYFRYGQYRCKTSGRHPDSLRPANLLPPAFVFTMTLTLFAPRPIRPVSRSLASLYLVTVLLESVRVVRGEARGADLGRVLLVFPTMHGAHGLGFMMGCIRFGIPMAAIGRALKATARPQP